MYRTAPPKESMIVRVTLTPEELTQAIKSYVEDREFSPWGNSFRLNFENKDMQVVDEPVISASWEEKV